MVVGTCSVVRIISFRVLLLPALRWVKKNIRYFGGDPSEITVSGQSAGGYDSSVLSISSQSRGLFSRGIFMSGTTGVDQPIYVGEFITGMMIARRENCTIYDESEPQSVEEWANVIECLRALPEERFTSLQGVPHMPFIGPSIDGDLLPRPIKGMFFDPYYMKRIGYQEKDFLISVTYNEGGIFKLLEDKTKASMSPEQLASMPADFMLKGQLQMLLRQAYGDVSPGVISRVYQFYEQNYEMSPIADFVTDAIYYIPSLEYAIASSLALSETDNHNLYFLRSVNFPEIISGLYQGTVHGLDLLYLIDIDLDDFSKKIGYEVNSSRWTQSDDDLKVKYQALLSSFVKTGIPVTSRSQNDDNPVDWPPFNREGGHYLVFNESPQVSQHLRVDRLDLWQHQIPAWIEELPVQKDS